MLQPEVQRFRLSSVGLGKDEHATGYHFPGEGLAGYVQGCILGTVINHDHAQVGIDGIQGGTYCAFDDLLFVIGRNQDGNFGTKCCLLCWSAISLMSQAIVDRENAHEQKTPGHEQVTQKENPGDALNADVE